MKTGTLIAIVVSVLGLSAMVVAFITSASPYVTIAEAKSHAGDNLHVAGDIVPDSMFTSAGAKEVRFRMKDPEGSEMSVIYSGTAPANMGSVARVVAVGGMKDGVFLANKLWIKCPSKYESTKNGAGPETKS